jgi:CTP synthase
VAEKLKGMQALVVPGGFGNCGSEGKIEAIRYVRENNIPFFGSCLGMQMAVVEYARNVLGLKDANSVEFNENTSNPVIHMMSDRKLLRKANTEMRIGAYDCVIEEGTLAHQVYGKKEISERHRHKYEFNNEYRESLENAGLKCSGLSTDGSIVEIVELKDHPYFIASQFHPEFKSRPNNPAPLFVGLIKAAKNV